MQEIIKTLKDNLKDVDMPIVVPVGRFKSEKEKKQAKGKEFRECAACEGTGISSKKDICKPCKGFGTIEVNSVIRLPHERDTNNNIDNNTRQCDDRLAQSFLGKFTKNPVGKMIGEYNLTTGMYKDCTVMLSKEKDGSPACIVRLKDSIVLILHDDGTWRLIPQDTPF